MYGISIAHIIVVTLAIVLLFGRNKVSSLMADIAGGIKNFKTGVRELEK